jgi:hypothetical protein
MKQIKSDAEEGAEFFEQVNSLDKEQRDEFAKVVKLLIRCFTKDDAKAVVVIKGVDVLSKVVALNCDEMEAANMLEGLRGYLEFVNMQDAPAKEMFN